MTMHGQKVAKQFLHIANDLVEQIAREKGIGGCEQMACKKKRRERENKRHRGRERQKIREK